MTSKGLYLKECMLLDVLNGEGYTICPGCSKTENTTSNTRCNDLSNDLHLINLL